MLSPLPLLLLALAVIGMGLSLATGGILQPDWSLAILLGALLARRGTWLWVLPALLIHDLALYWTPWGVFPLACLLPALLQWFDAQLGPGLPQRMGMLILVSMPMLVYDAGLIQWLLTLLLCIPVWHLLVHMYDSQIA